MRCENVTYTYVCTFMHICTHTQMAIFDMHIATKYININCKLVINMTEVLPLLTQTYIEVLQGARLSLNGFSHHQFSQHSLVFSAILRVNGIRRSMAKTIVTIAI